MRKVLTLLPAMWCLWGAMWAQTGRTVPAARADSAIASYLRQTWGADFSDNNRVVVFKSGAEKFADMFEAVRNARHSIHMEYFNFRNDSISSLLFGLLTQKADEGVEVRILFDGFGNSSNDRPLKRWHLDSLRARGIEIYNFDPLRFPWINHAFHRDHRKIVVVDGQVAYTGGMNVADYYIKGKPEFGEWRDMHFRVEGDAVGDLQAVFVRFWNRVVRDTLHGTQYYPGEKDARDDFPTLAADTARTAGSKRVAVVNRDPETTPRIIHDTFVEAINGAQRQIQIINPYFTLCKHIKRALKKAARRGVDVQVMVSAKSDIPITPRIVEYNTRRLAKAGVDVYVYEGGFHHSKIMMVDSLYAFVGSANLNSRSLSFDYECNLLIADRPTTHTLQRIFETDKREHCRRLQTVAAGQKKRRWRRLEGWLFHFLTPFV